MTSSAPIQNSSVSRFAGSLGPGARLALLAIAAYRLALAPILGGHCRFQPSCSVFAEEAILRYGAALGGRLAVKRLGRCHPGRAGGFDPVP